MQTALTAAAVLSVVTGLVHSVLGERLIFRHLRRGTLVPQLSAPPLRARNIRIIWASWHLASVFGWALAAVLFGLAQSPEAPIRELAVQAIVAANAGGSLLVLVGTRGRHPGWIAVGAIAVLAWFGAYGV